MQEQKKHNAEKLPGGFFFSPRPDRRTPNTYIKHFYEQLAEKAGVVNTGTKEHGRSVELARHVLQTRVLVLNWPEDILHLRFGIGQAILFNLCTLLVKARGGKVVWICHNKESHNKTKPLLGKWNRNFFKRIADHIIVHATDALEVMQDVAQKTVFMPHPRYERSTFTAPAPVQEPEVLIWGSITPYKGLDRFIAAYKQRKASFKVSIRGKANPSYFTTLQTAVAGTSITLSNELLSEEELNRAFARCSIILLPYLDSDTFSSGALIHSLNARKVVLGPHVGNFIDLAKAGACVTYRNDDELFALLDQMVNNRHHYANTLEKLQKGIDRFYDAHSWDAFTRKFLTQIGFAGEPIHQEPPTLPPLAERNTQVKLSPLNK